MPIPDITHVQFAALHAVQKHDGSEPGADGVYVRRRLNEIGAAYGPSSPAFYQLMSRLVRNGLLRKYKNGVYRVTKAGEAALVAVYSFYAEVAEW